MKVLVTGAGGALGHYVIEALHEHESSENFVVATCGRGATGAGSHHYAGDLLDPAYRLRVASDFKPDVAFLLAWETKHGSYWADPVNADWADATLDFAQQMQSTYGTFVTVAGSCAEYDWGRPQMLESDISGPPRTFYGQQKLRVTQQLVGKNCLHPGLANCCRIFFPFSEMENDSRVTSLVVKSALAGRPLHLKSGDVFRDICHTRHIAREIVDLAVRRQHGVFNMSPLKPAHLGQFLRRIGESLGAPDTVTWDAWSQPSEKNAEPRILHGSRTRSTANLDLANISDEDVQLFSRASANRFS